MSNVLIVTGSPSSSSRTLRVAGIVSQRLGQLGVDSALLDLRALPAEDLLHARAERPLIAAALERIHAARGVVFATPVYKAAYSGLLKTFIDVFPQFGLRGKVVLPLALGGTPAHVLAIDYGLRPVLSSLDPLHVVAGLFILDKHVATDANGGVTLEADPSSKLDAALAAFASALVRAASPLSA